MARPERNTVDYYPHIVGEGKKMYFIDKKYGNDGYATVFKILDKLATSDFHYLDLNKEEELMYLASKCNVSEERLMDIITDLVKLGKFDKELWEHKIIWDQLFVDNIQEAYKKRNNKCITLQGLRVLLKGLGVLKHTMSQVNSPVKPHRIEENRREENRREDKSKDLLSESPEGDQTSPPKINKWIENFDKRKSNFKASLYPFTNSPPKYNGNYPKNMVADFFEYWSEPNKSRSRMRWETEKTWDLSKRLATWSKNDRVPVKKEEFIITGPSPVNHDDRS